MSDIIQSESLINDIPSIGTDSDSSPSSSDSSCVFRYSNLSPYLCKLVLAEPCPEAAWGRGGLLGEHMFYFKEDCPSLSKTVSMLIYLTGLFNEPLIEYLFGIPHARYVHKVIRTLEDKGAVYKINSKFYDYQSNHFLFPNINQPPFSEFRDSRYSPTDAEHLTNKPSERIIPHAYGVTLSCMMFRLYCMLTESVYLRNIVYEVSVRGNNVTTKQGASVTADALLQIRLASDRKFGVFLEFDTGSEPISQLCRKFADYYNVDLYSSKPTDVNRSCILFSFHSGTPKPDRLCVQHLFEDYFRFLVHLVLSHFYVGTFEQVLDMDVLPLLADNDGFPAFYKSVAEHPRIHKHYHWFSTDNEKLLNCKMVLPYIYSNFGLSDFLSLAECPDESYLQGIVGLFTVSSRFDSEFVREMLEMIGFIDCYGKYAAKRLPLRVLFDYIVNYADDKGIRMRMGFNRDCYQQAFNRHLNITSAFFGEITGLSCLSSRNLPKLIEGYDDRFLSVPHYLPLLNGYRLYTAPAHLLGNYIDEMIPNNGGSAFIKQIGNIVSNIYMKDFSYMDIGVNYLVAAGSQFNEVKIRFRDTFVSDDLTVIPIRANYDTSALLSASIMYHYYDGSNGNVEFLFIVNSISEAIEINRRCILRTKKSDRKSNFEDFSKPFINAAGCKINYILSPDNFFSLLSDRFL